MSSKQHKPTRAFYANSAVGGTTVRFYVYDRTPKGFIRFLDRLAMPFLAQQVYGQMMPALTDVVQKHAEDTSTTTASRRLDLELNDIHCELVVSVRLAKTVSHDMVETIIFYEVIVPFALYLKALSAETMLVRGLDGIIEAIEDLFDDIHNASNGNKPQRSRRRGLHIFSRN
jgi:hypothetical protein